MILVTGAGGNVGGEVARQLVAAGEPVRALVRRPGSATGLGPGVDVVTGDLAEPDGLAAAMDGARALFLLGGFETMDGVLTRAADAGVGHVVLLTSRCVVGGRPDNAITGMWMRSEASLTRSGLPGTVLRPAGFQSNVLRWADQLAAGDVVRAPWPDAPIAAIDPADIAAVAVAALTDDRYAGGAHELSGPQALTPADQVAVLAAGLGRPLRFDGLDRRQARESLLADGWPEAMVTAQERFFADGEYDDSRVVDTVERVTGRPPRSLADWVGAHRAELS